MNKKLIFRYLYIIISLFFFSYSLQSCQNDTVITPEEQAAKDDEIIINFLKSHTISQSGGSVKTKEDGQKSLYELCTKDPSGIYYYIHEQGKGKHPTKTTEVKVHYEGFIIPSTIIFDSSFNRGHPSVFKLNETIEGWQVGIPKFKSETGKGFLFIPSGLAYKTSYRTNVPANSCLGFRIELLNL